MHEPSNINYNSVTNVICIKKPKFNYLTWRNA